MKHSMSYISKIQYYMNLVALVNIKALVIQNLTYTIPIREITWCKKIVQKSLIVTIKSTIWSPKSSLTSTVRYYRNLGRIIYGFDSDN
jgi:hypothetical protein